MNNGTWRTYGPWIATWNGPWTSGTNGYLGYKSVASSGQVNGDHHTPYPWSYDILQVRYPYGSAQTVYPNAGEIQTWSGYYPGAYDPIAPSWASHRDLLYNRALSRLNDSIRGDLDLGVSLAEFAQTRRMVGEAVANIRHFALSGFGTSRDLANGLLVWKYGWKPLFSDLFGALNESLNIALTTIRKVHGSASDTLDGKSLQDIHFFGYGPKPWIAENRYKGKASCRIVLVLEVPGVSLDRWSSLNPVSLGWELIPYSFVVDWVYDVGSFLRNTETAFLYNARFKSGYVSELYVCDTDQRVPAGQTFTVYPGDTWEAVHTITNELRASARRRNFRRSTLTSHPLPRPPSLKVDLGSEQLLTLAALLRQLLK